MKRAQLRSLIKHGESEILEFKQSTGSLDPAMHTICAFLNSGKGGTVILGVKDNGQLVGQIVDDTTKNKIGNALSKIEPYEKIDVMYVAVSAGHKAIVFRVNSGEKAPYIYDGRPYIRHESITTRMSKEEYASLYSRHNPCAWERSTSNPCKINDLDYKKIKAVIRMGVSEKRLSESAQVTDIPNVLKKLELISNGKPTNAAVILFCKNEEKQFTQSTVKLARFRGTDKFVFIDNKEFKGNAFELYDKAMDFLAFALPIAAHIEEGNPDRVETPPVPWKVLREALANALIHRDYSHAGGSVAVAIYDDRINITNIGALPVGVKLSQLSKEHPSILRNPLIAKAFYICGKIEKWGRGTLDMIEYCKKAGNPAPRFEEVGDAFSVTFPFREPISSITSVRVLETPKLSPRQRKIIHILEGGPLHTQQIMDKMGISISSRMMQFELAKLRKMGLIKSEGQTKAMLWFLPGK